MNLIGWKDIWNLETYLLAGVVQNDPKQCNTWTVEATQMSLIIDILFEHVWEYWVLSHFIFRF